MLIAGAKGHALEILDVLFPQYAGDEIVFFDNISDTFKIDTINRFCIIRTEEELEELFKKDNRFVLGIGNPVVRKKMAEYLASKKGALHSVISANAIISKHNVKLGTGLNIMHGVIIQPEVSIGDGTLINAAVILHHQSTVGAYCEICPGAIITGNVQIGNNTFIGSGAIVLPGIKIGSNVKIGAGAVVINDVEDGITVVGNPAQKTNKK